MKQILAPLTLCLTLALAAPTPLFAQDAQADPDEGLSLMERGLRQLFEGLMADMEPALGEMAQAVKEMEPMLRQLAKLIGDVRYYDPPERLENGDIIIRRKEGAPPPPSLPSPDVKPPLYDAPDGQIDL